MSSEKAARVALDVIGLLVVTQRIRRGKSEAFQETEPNDRLSREEIVLRTAATQHLLRFLTAEAKSKESEESVPVPRQA